MDRWTDGKLQEATQKQCEARWGGAAPGARFRCYLCGHKFVPGDKWRWVYLNSTPDYSFGNAMACEACDGPDIIERFVALGKMIRERLWWLYEGGDR